MDGISEYGEIAGFLVEVTAKFLLQGGTRDCVLFLNCWMSLGIGRKYLCGQHFTMLMLI
jgi:hypothetical protein